MARASGRFKKKVLPPRHETTSRDFQSERTRARVYRRWRERGDRRRRVGGADRERGRRWGDPAAGRGIEDTDRQLPRGGKERQRPRRGATARRIVARGERLAIVDRGRG